MPQKAASPPAYSASSDPLALARQARAEALRDWLSALGQKRLIGSSCGMLLGSSCGMACFKWLNDRRFALAVTFLLIASGLSFLL